MKLRYQMTVTGEGDELDDFIEDLTQFDLRWRSSGLIFLLSEVHIAERVGQGLALVLIAGGIGAFIARTFG